MNRNKTSWKLTKEEKDGLVALYDSGMSIIKIAKKYGMAVSSIHYLLQKNNYKVRSDEEIYRKRTLNQKAFSKITEESAYWIGFLMADGCITSKKGNSPILSIATDKNDLSHLKKFRLFLNSSHAISFFKPRAYNLKINSKELCADLEKYGVVPRKSHIAKVKLLENNRDFWRGVFDGDGSISFFMQGTYPNVYISLCGSRYLIGQFLEFVQHSGVKTYRKIHTMKSIYAISFTSNMAKKILYILYHDSNIYLIRKFNRYKKALSLINKKGKLYWTN